MSKPPRKTDKELHDDIYARIERELGKEALSDVRALVRGELIPSVIEAGVLAGDIRLEGRTDEEIRNDIDEYLDNITSGPAEHSVRIDYKVRLINEAQRYEASGDVELALMFYATWFEHWLNHMYIEREPMVVLDREQIIRLIRETNLPSKTGHIWQLLFGEELPDDIIQTILKVAEARNAFVHYKWTPHGDEDAGERRELHDLAQRAAAIVTQLDKIEDRLLFGGSRVRLAQIIRDMWMP
jgi:hypothetical protein